MRSRALAIIGVVAGIVALIGFLNVPRDIGVPPEAAEASTTTPVPSPTVTSTTVEPGTTTQPRPLWTANETSLLTEVAPTTSSTPTRLIIDAIEIDAPIAPYGVDGNGQMDVPDNVTEVGWYKHGPSPGESGSAVLAAHVDLRGPGRGLFYDLGDLQIGDMVEIGYDDGSTSEFEVVARSTYLKTELPLDIIFSRSGDPVVTLVTCGGGFSRSEGRYDSNVVVYAVPTTQESDVDGV